MAFFGLPIVNIEDLRAGLSPKPRTTFLAKDIKSMEDLSNKLHTHVDESFKTLHEQINALKKKPESAPIDTNSIIKELKASIKGDIATILKDTNTIKELSGSITTNKEFVTQLNTSIKTQFDTLSGPLKAELDRLKAEHTALQTKQNTLSTEHTALQQKHKELEATHANISASHSTIVAAHTAITNKITELENKPSSTPAELAGLNTRLQALETSQKSITDIGNRLGLLETYLNEDLKTGIKKIINAFPSMTEKQIIGALDKINGILGNVTTADIELLKGLETKISSLSEQLKTKLTDDKLIELKDSITSLKNDLAETKSKIPNITTDKFNSLSTEVKKINNEILAHAALIDRRVTKREFEQELDNYVRKTKIPVDTGYIDSSDLSRKENEYMTIGETGTTKKTPVDTGYIDLSNLSRKENEYMTIGETGTTQKTPEVSSNKSESTSFGSKVWDATFGKLVDTKPSAPRTISMPNKNKYLKGGSKYSRKFLSESSDELELNNTLSDTSVN